MGTGTDTKLCLLVTLAGICAGCSAAAASAATRVARAPDTRLFATFVPKRLGAATTIGLKFKIAQPMDLTPPPLSGIDVSYPSNLSFATSGLGMAACDPTALEELGSEACPANSQMGGGAALTEVPFGLDVVTERIKLSLFAGPSPDGFLHLLILAEGSAPVMGRVVLTAVLLPGHLQIAVPRVPSLPGGADVAFTSITATLGGSLTYYERSHGRTIAYRPKGIGLPAQCPTGGWKLRGNLAFLNGQRSKAETVISCPRQRASRRR
jgi:hypothetical protein